MVNNLNLSTFFDDFEVKHLEIANSSEKQVSFKLRVIFSTNFWPKTKKIVRAVFEKNTKVSDFGLIWRLFREYLQIKNFFFKILALWLFYLCSPLTSFKKSEKSLAPFFEKTALTNYQPTNHYQQQQPCRSLLTQVQKICYRTKISQPGTHLIKKIND